MHTRLLLLIDQDGVLADFEAGTRQQWQAAYGSPLPVAERRHFYLRDDIAAEHRPALQALYARAGFFADLPPVGGAVAAMQALLDYGHDVRICTSPIRDYRHCVAEKFAWVEQHLGSEWIGRMLLTQDKTWVRGDVLIDDKPQISGSLTPVWTQWLYDAPYNRQYRDRRRVQWTQPHTWADLLGQPAA